MASAATPIATPEPSSSAAPPSSAASSSSSTSVISSTADSTSSAAPAPTSSTADGGGGGGGGSSSGAAGTSSTAAVGGGGGGSSSSSAAGGGGGGGGGGASSSTSRSSSTSAAGGGGSASTASSFTSASTTTQASIISISGQAVSTVYVTSVSTSTSTTTPSRSAVSGSSHTGAIVGGVVGGVVGLAVIGLLILFCIRRKRNKDDFDGNFDPDRVLGHSTGGGTLPQIDVDDEEAAAAAATPYAYQRSDGGMSQFGGSSSYPLAAGAAVGASARSAGSTSPSHYPSSEDHHNMPTSPVHQPMSSISSGSNYGPYGNLPPGAGRAPSPSAGQLLYDNNPISAKEREAQAARYGSRNRLGLATQVDEPANPRTSLGRGGSGQGSIGSGNVVVHQDGGRVQVPPNDHEPPSEIPPTYDSIPADDRA